MNVRIKVPDEIFNRTSGDASRQILEAFALEGYKSKQLTAAQVGKILGFQSRAEVLDFLAENKIAWIDYSIEDAERERKLLRKITP